MAESDQLVEVLKEIRDELRAVRIELGARGSRMTTSGVRTERVARQRHHDRWRNAALAGGGVAGLALLLLLVTRDRPAPAPVPATAAVASQSAPPPAASPARVPSGPGSAAILAPAPVVQASPVVARGAGPAAKPPAVAPTPATRQAARLPSGAAAPATTLAAIPASGKKRVKPEAAKSPAELGSDEDEALAFPPPPPRRVRVHRLSYGPVESEPAKL